MGVFVFDAGTEIPEGDLILIHELVRLCTAEPYC